MPPSRVLTLVACVVVFPGCSDSSAPHLTAAATAQRLNAIRTRECSGSRHRTSSPWGVRCAVLNIALHSAALGAAPTPVRVTTAAGTETWLAYTTLTAQAGSNGSWLDSSFEVAVYRDDTVSAGVYGVIYYVNGIASAGATLAGPDSLTGAERSASGSVSAEHIGQPCTPTVGIVDSLGQPWNSVCQLATFGVTLHATFAPAAGIDTTLRSFTLDNQTIGGLRDVPAGGGAQRRAGAWTALAARRDVRDLSSGARRF